MRRVPSDSSDNNENDVQSTRYYRQVTQEAVVVMPVSSDGENEALTATGKCANAGV